MIKSQRLLTLKSKDGETFGVGISVLESFSSFLPRRGIAKSH